MSRRWWTMTGVLALVGASLVPATAASGVGGPAPAAKPRAERSEGYLVVMSGQPLLRTVGRKNLQGATARAKRARLVAEQNAAVASIGKRAADKTYSYTNAANGFAIDLTATQAKALERRKDVALVVKDEKRTTLTDASPTFLGLAGRDGVWAKGWTGEGTVVGVIDSGIWPEHPSFADDGSYKPPATPLENTPTNRSCNFGNTAHNPLDVPFTCNNKLIGAREFLNTYKRLVGIAPNEYDSARDDDGHGTHTASTAAGNAGVRAQIFGVPRGRVSGIAPRAQVIAYKALGTGGGFNSDLAAAIDQAAADGVDVINYSVGGGARLFSLDTLSFLVAQDAGVAVAASAGNDGPDPATIGGPANVPWLTTVGASTQPRFFQGTLVLGDGRKITGASVTRGIGSVPLVDAASAGDPFCRAGRLDPAKVAGAMVLCLRGVNGRAAKAAAVKAAGGVAMVLYNTTDVDDLFTDNFQVPSVMLDNTPGLAVKGYIASARRPTARIVADQRSTLKYAPSMALFSSRGPNVVPDGVAEDIIKPDVTAPGVQILAGTSPTPQATDDAPGQLFMSIAGTSMSSPHVAGALALISQAHPDWSPAMIKSALMTTAYQDVVDNDRTTPADPFARGSGHIDPAGQQGKGTPFDPGLVYDAGILEYLGFLCESNAPLVDALFGTGLCAALPGIGVATTAVDLNYPSIGISAVTGSQTVTRTVTRVAAPGSTSTRAERFVARVSAPAGFSVTVSPSVLRLAPGQTATYTVTVSTTTAQPDVWSFGSLTWKSERHDVYSPIAVKAKALLVPGLVRGSGASGSVDVPVKFGYTGAYTAAAHGLVPATVSPSTVADDPDQNFDPTDGFSDPHPITVTGAAHLRITLPPDAVADPNATDLDIYLLDAAGNEVASSTAGGTDEQIDLDNPPDGTYTLWVHGWEVGATPVPYTLYDWVISATPGGNLAITAAPAAATVNTSGTVTAAWSGAPAEWNLGAVSHSDASGVLALTLVEVDNRP